MEKSNTKKLQESFWNEIPIDDKRTEIVIDKYKLQKFLVNAGFRKYYIGDFQTFIRIKGKIIFSTNTEKIKDYVLNYVRGLTNDKLEEDKRVELESKLIESSYYLLSKNFFSLLMPFSEIVIKDQADSAIFYFRNCVIKVTNKAIDKMSYDDFEGYIWQDQIIQHDLKLTNGKSDFNQFLVNICKGDKERLKALISSIGYLLHNFNDPSLSKAIVYCDESIDGSSGLLEGRSGKSLVVKAISQLRKSVTFDGKNFKLGNRFAFQSVNNSTQIMNFNDVRANFNFESLFSVLTEGLTVEKKNKDAFEIKFEDMPKVVITTNFTIQGKGGSFEDRLFEVEFSDYYNSNHKPKDDFGKNFFFDWDGKEWDKFYSLMMRIEQYYLANGLQSYQTKNLAKRKIIQEIGSELFEFFETLSIGEDYDKKELYEKFISTSVVVVSFQQRSFTAMLRSYARYKGYEIIERKSSGQNLIKFVEKPNE